MGLLKYTKNFSSSDDGSTLTGSQVGTLQTDISAILNGGISNINVASDAAIVESKLSFNTTSGHNHDGSNSRVISAGGQRGFIQGAYIDWVATDQVKAQSGIVEISGTLYTRTSYSTTLDLDTNGHWVEGTSQRGTNKWVYVYAYNDSGSSWDIKYWLQAPQYANTGTDDSSVKIFRQNASVWYRCLGAVRLNSTGSGEVNKFFQQNNLVMWDVPVNLTTTASSGAWSSALACSSAIPPVSNVGIFGVWGTVSATVDPIAAWLRPNGGTWDATNRENAVIYFDDDNAGGTIYPNVGRGGYVCFTDGSQQIQYYTSACAGGFRLSVQGFYVNIR